MVKQNFKNFKKQVPLILSEKTLADYFEALIGGCARDYLTRENIEVAFKEALNRFPAIDKEVKGWRY
jgi:hypothetical protein